MCKVIRDITVGIASILKGLAVTGKNMFRRPVTMPYPFEKPVMADRFRGLVDLYPEKCIACSQCVKICPTAALKLTVSTNPETKKRVPGTFLYNGEWCCFCGLCQEVCPTAAIFMNHCYEVAYDKHEELTAIDLLRSGKYVHLVPPAINTGLMKQVGVLRKSQGGKT